MSHSLFQSNIIRRLKFGLPPTIDHRLFFDEVMCAEIDGICAYFGCEAEISRIDLLDAQEVWVEDIDDVYVAESTEPDHFKHAGWLCHWLRKKRPIQRIIPHDETKLEDFFEDAYNEIAAFIIGLKLVIYYESCEKGLDDQGIIQASQIGIYKDMLPDIGLYLNHKNVSPHAIYLLYKALMHRSPFGS